MNSIPFAHGSELVLGSSGMWYLYVCPGHGKYIHETTANPTFIKLQPLWYEEECRYIH